MKREDQNFSSSCINIRNSSTLPSPTAFFGSLHYTMSRFLDFVLFSWIFKLSPGSCAKEALLISGTSEFLLTIFFSLFYLRSSFHNIWEESKQRNFSTAAGGMISCYLSAWSCTRSRILAMCCKHVGNMQCFICIHLSLRKNTIINAVPKLSKDFLFETLFAHVVTLCFPRFRLLFWRRVRNLPDRSVLTSGFIVDCRTNSDTYSSRLRMQYGQRWSNRVMDAMVSFFCQQWFYAVWGT